MPEAQHIGIAELQQRLEAGEKVLILDVRSPEEYRALHAKGAVSLPLGDVTREAVERCLTASSDGERPRPFFICHSGKRASDACQRVLEHFPNAAVVEGGTLAWAQAGLAVSQGTEP